jgi:hypothetical protein
MAVSPFLILQARAEARAILYRAYEFDFAQATAPLRAFALHAGIVDQIGAAETTAIINAAFNTEEPTNNGDG